MKNITVFSPFNSSVTCSRKLNIFHLLYISIYIIFVIYIFLLGLMVFTVFLQKRTTLLPFHSLRAKTRRSRLCSLLSLIKLEELGPSFIRLLRSSLVQSQGRMCGNLRFKVMFIETIYLEGGLEQDHFVEFLTINEILFALSLQNGCF